jgi:hypothetical protein
VCNGALSPAEDIACAAPGSAVRTLMESVAELTERTSGNGDADDSARIWAASREACMTLQSEDGQLACVVQAYRVREATLRSVAGKPGWIAAPGYRLFLSSESAYPTTRGSRGLYGRILPILLDSAVAAVILRSDGKGLVEAKGQALAGCSFEIGGLAYDDALASLNVVTRPRTRRAPPELEPLATLTGRSARLTDEALARFPGCADTSGFPRLEEITLDEALLEVIWDRF